MTSLDKDYTVSLSNRRELENGSVKYDLQVIDDGKSEIIVDTTYTLSKRQEDPDQPGPGVKEMVRSFAEKKAEEYEKNIGKDHSGESISL
jgi:hypothetical protein